MIVVTNQSGVARGFYDEAAVKLVQRAHPQETCRREGARIDAFYYCPHHPDGTVKELAIRCRCRKPQPGMLEQAARDWPIDLAAQLPDRRQGRRLAAARISHSGRQVRCAGRHTGGFGAQGIGATRGLISRQQMVPWPASQNDAQRDAHRRSDAGFAAGRLRWHRRDQHDPQRTGCRPRHAATRALGRGLHDARRLLLPGGDADRAADVHGNRLR